MSNLVKCSNGHVYDADVFVSCPHCQNGESGQPQDADEWANETLRSTHIEWKDGRLRQTAGNGTPRQRQIDWETQNLQPDSNAPEKDPDESETVVSHMQEPVSSGKAAPQKEAKAGSQISGDPDKTVSILSDGGDYFVAGWLVCVEGADRGHSFPLYHGYNSVGSGEESQIRILGEPAMSGGVHCRVVYEDRKNRFFLVPEEGYETRLNDTCVEQPAEMHTDDSIRIGETCLVLLAFCRGDRKWDHRELYR